MNMDEFGVDLFEAVKVASGLAWCRKHAHERVADLEQQLSTLLPKLTNPHDVRRILELSQRVG